MSTPGFRALVNSASRDRSAVGGAGLEISSTISLMGTYYPTLTDIRQEFCALHNRTHAGLRLCGQFCQRSGCYKLGPEGGQLGSHKGILIARKNSLEEKAVQRPESDVSALPTRNKG